MVLQEALASIETAETEAALSAQLHRAIGYFGFKAFCFLDIDKQQTSDVYYVGSIGTRWEQEYASNGFYEVDEVIRVARRVNRPFAWSEVPLPERLGKRRSGALRVFEASRDYRFEDGYVVPLHFVDLRGHYHSALLSLIWSEPHSAFERTRAEHAAAITLLASYWIQRAVELRQLNEPPRNVMARHRAALAFRLTDRERDVLAWAARGKTVQDTADILLISETTVSGYISAAMSKLEASTKTQAVAKALHLGLIDL